MLGQLFLSFSETPHTVETSVERSSSGLLSRYQYTRKKVQMMEETANRFLSSTFPQSNLSVIFDQGSNNTQKNGFCPVTRRARHYACNFYSFVIHYFLLPILFQLTSVWQLTWIIPIVGRIWKVGKSLAVPGRCEWFDVLGCCQDEFSISWESNNLSTRKLLVVRGLELSYFVRT